MLPTFKPNYVFQGGNRYYSLSGKLYPGVTTILGKTQPKKKTKSLEDWRKRVGEEEANRISKAALDRGTALHRMIEEHLMIGYNPWLSEEDDATLEEVIPYWDSIYPTLLCVNSPLLIEGTVWDEKTGFAGSVDCIAVYNGYLRLIDWKTASNANYLDSKVTDYAIQLSAYRMAIHSIYGLLIDNASIVIALPNSPAIVLDLGVEELDRGFKKFCSRLKAFKGNDHHES
jgi:genome maintenance exonuclease 1